LQQNDSDNIVDLGNTQLSVFDLRDLQRTIWKNHTEGAPGTWLMGPDTYEIIAMLLNAWKQGGLNDTSVTFDVSSISNGYLGTIKPMVVHGWPEGSIACIDPKDWEYGPYKNCDWQVVRRTPENTDKPTNEWAMWGDFSLICTNLRRQGLITGVDTRLNNYLGRSSFVL
jgi:hypothetical protein